MFDPVTAHALRRRRSRAPLPSGAPEAPRSSRICTVCGRDVALGEELFLVDKEVHCSQCHGMLAYELGKEREADATARSKGTKWEARGGKGDGGPAGR